MGDVKNLCVYILDLNKFYPIVGYMWDGEPEVKIRNNNGLVYISSEDRYYALIWNGKNFSIGLEPIEPKEESELFEGSEYVQYIDPDYAPENFKYNDHLFNEDRRILQLTKDIILDESNITNYQEAKRLSYTYSIEDDVFKFIEYPEVIYDLNIIVWDTVYDSNFIDSLTPDNNVKFQNTLLQPGEDDYITIKPIEGKYPKETDNYKGIAILGSDGSVLSLALSIEIEPNEKQFKIKFSVPNVINQNCLLFVPENILVLEGEEEAPLLTAVYEYEEPTPPTPPPAPDPEATIVSYSNQTLLNSSTSKTFDGLISYGSISTNNNNVRRKNDTIFINENSGINQIIIHPVLRTLALFSDNTTRVVIYNNDEYPVSVFIVETITNDYETYTKHHVITYNQNYTLPLDARCKKIQITFKVGETTLYRTIQFYKLPDILYTKYFGSGSNNQFSTSEYDSIIDALTGNPIISKYGCLLLTNEYDVIETTEVEENNETVLKGVAELVPTTKVRMGNLNGIYNETFGTNQPRGFGLYGESVYLTGNFYLNNGKSLVDISNQVTLAVGDIANILNTLSNLDSSLHDSIYNLTLALNSNIAGVSGDLHQTANLLQEQIDEVTENLEELEQQLESATNAITATFNQAIANNTEALFKLGKDYSIWTVGNAGISIINPNAKYDNSGNVIPSTVGDGDEYIVLQGESVRIATNIKENNRIKVVVANIAPNNFLYNQTSNFTKLYSPNNVTFSFKWVPLSVYNNTDPQSVQASTYTLTNDSLPQPGVPYYTRSGNGEPYQYTLFTGETFESGVNYYVINDASGFFRYVALNNSATVMTSYDSSHHIYSFSIYRQISGNNIYSTSSTSSADGNSNSNYYVIPDITLAGMFIDGKFNADLIEVKNILAIDLVSTDSNLVLLYKKNPNFDINSPITDSNYPVLKNLLTFELAKTAPFATISGTTGKITAQGMQMKEATIGDSTGDNEHIRISDNKGILVGYVYNGSNVTDTKPAMYFKKGNDVVVKVSSDDSKEILKFFNNTSTTLSNNQTKTLFNGATIKYSRLLDITNASIIAEDANGNEGTYTNYSEFGTFDGDNYFFTKVDKTQAYSPSLTYYKKSGTSFVVADATDIELNSNVDIYRRSGLSFYYNEFIPTRANTQVTGENGELYYRSNCYHSDIGKISYNKTSGTLTSSSDIGSYRTFIAGKNYEISGSANINLENLSSVLRYKKLSVNDGLTDISKRNQITEESSYVSGLADLIAGSFEIKLNIVLVNIYDSGDRKTLKTITYGISNYNFSEYGDITYNSYTKINNLTNPTTNTMSSSIPSITKKSYNHFGNSIKFSKIVNFNSNGNYKIVLEASVLFLQTGWMSQYKCNAHVDDNPSGSINGDDFITPPDAGNEYYSFNGNNNSYSVGIPMSNNYEWYPLLCPKEYEIRPQINITNCTIRLIEIKDKTIILANGLLSGYESSNQFSITFNQSTDFINFKKAEFVKGVGHILNQNGPHNAFILADGSEKLIKLPIPVLYGSFVPKITKPLYSSNDYPNNYYYYQFSGYSLIENTTLYANNHGGPDGDWYLTSSNFSILQTSPGNYIEISGFVPHWRDLNITTLYGTIYYMKDYDIYLCTNKDPGTQVCLFFGEHWNSLFTLFGTNVFATVTPKYARLGSNDLVGFNRVPIIVNNTAVYKNTTLKYRTTNSLGTLSNTDLSINTKVGFEFSSIDARNTFVYNSDNPSLSYNKIVPVRGYFDVMIYYIPETT